MMDKKKDPAAAEYKPPDAGCMMNCGYDYEYIEFSEYCQKAYVQTKEMLMAADCKSAARRLKKYLALFDTGPLAVRQIGVDWIGVMDSLLEAYCRDAIINQIKNTRKDSQERWTKELLDKKIAACQLDDTARAEIYEMAGIDEQQTTYKITKFEPQDAEHERVSHIISKVAVSG